MLLPASAPASGVGRDISISYSLWITLRIINNIGKQEVISLPKEDGSQFFPNSDTDMNEHLLIVFYNLSIELSIFMLEFNHLSQYKYYGNFDFILFFFLVILILPIRKIEALRGCIIFPRSLSFSGVYLL